MKQLMGIINVNNESFYSQSRCTDAQENINRINSMVEMGADIIDLGACSTRPGSIPISQQTEWKYIKNTLIELSKLKHSNKEFISNGKTFKVSIDTFYAQTVKDAYNIIGDFIVNDISSGEDDPLMLECVGERNLKYIAMHKRGTPSTMQQMCDYPNGVVNEVIEYFIKFKDKAYKFGITDYIVDPGYGFAKTIEQNYQLLMGIEKIKKELNCKLLVGISRKGMIWKYLGITPNDCLCANTALNLQALMLGADIIRVHDVKEGSECIKLQKMLEQAIK